MSKKRNLLRKEAQIFAYYIIYENDFLNLGIVSLPIA